MGRRNFHSDRLCRNIIKTSAMDVRFPWIRVLSAIFFKRRYKVGFVLLVQPSMVPTAQSYYMDRRTRLMPEPGSKSFGIEEIESLIKKGANALVAVDTPYGSGIELLRGQPGVLDYLRSKGQTVIEHEHYMIFKLPQAN